MSGSVPDPTLTGGVFGDPFSAALAGAAQGFAQGAMPVPYKGGIPFGATLGMAAGDAMAGGRGAYAAQTAAAQAKQAQMQTQLAQAGMPLALAKTRAMTDFWEHPEQIQQMMGGGAPASSPAASPAPAGGADPNVLKNALASLPDDATRSLAVNTAFRSGLPMEAWAPWISAVHNESGWNLKAGDGKAGEIGPGQVMPATGQQVGFTPDQLRDPATNLLASARYFGQQWKGGGGNPAAAFTGYNAGTPTGTATPGYVNNGMNRLGQWGYAGAGAGGGPTSPAEAAQLAQQYEQQANNLERQQTMAKFWQQQGLPAFAPPGDPATLRQAALQYRDMALAGPKAQATKAGEANVELATAGPIQAAKENQKISVDRYGNMYRGSQYLGRGSEVRPVWNPETRQMEYGDVGGVGVGALPPGVGSTGQASAPPPAYEAQLHVLREHGVMPPVPGAPGTMPAGGTQPAGPGRSITTLPNGGSAITDTRPAQQIDYDRDSKDMMAAGDELQGLQVAAAQMAHTNDLIKQNPTMGFGGNFRTTLANFAETYMPSWGAKGAEAILGLPDAATSQELAKMLLKNAGSSERQDLGARGGFRAMELYTKVFPSNDTQQNAAAHMMNMARIANQANIDYLQGAQDYFSQQGKAYRTGTDNYTPLPEFDRQWMQQGNAQTYAAAIAAMNGSKFSDWSKGLSKDQGLRTLQIIARVDPNAQVTGDDGKPWVVSRFMPQQQAAAQ